METSSNTSEKIVTYSSFVIQQIERYITPHRPERGGFLFGYIDGDSIYIEHFEYDSNGSVTGVSYVPSRDRDTIVNRIQEEKGLFFLGILHSHPSYIDHPSGPDEDAMEEIMKINSHITLVVAPIVTEGVYKSLQYHEMKINPNHKLSSYIKLPHKHYAACTSRFSTESYKPLSKGVQYSIIDSQVVNSFKIIAEKIIESESVVLQTSYNSCPISLLLFEDKFNDLKFGIMIHQAVGITAPLLTVKWKGSQINFPPLSWDLSITDIFERFTQSLLQIVVKFHGESLTIKIGSLPSYLLDLDGFNSIPPGLRPFLIKGTPPQLKSLPHIFDRLEPQFVSTVTEKHVVIFGCGSVGAAISEQLVRAGCRRLTLVDIETVSIENMSRTVYTLTDCGKLKVVALKERLLSINPQLNINTDSRNILEPEVVKDMIVSFDFGHLLIAATDSIDVQIRLSQIGRGKKILTVFPGLHMGAVTGEIFIVYPDSPCYQCLTKRGVTNIAGDIGKLSIDYESRRVSGVTAVGCDIFTIVTLTTKIVLGILCYKYDSKNETGMEVIGDYIIRNKISLIWTTNYYKEHLLALKQWGYNNLPFYAFAVGSFWIPQNSFTSILTCDCCGTSPVDLSNRVWSVEEKDLSNISIPDIDEDIEFDDVKE